MRRVLGVCALAVTMVTAGSAREPEAANPAFNKAVVEANLLVGLATSNLGLQRSCAFMLGQIDSKRGVIPLMAILRSSEDEKLRLAAAWALAKIGNPFGTYLVKMSVQFDESAKVRESCAWYYNLYVKGGTFVIIEPAEVLPIIAQKFEPMVYEEECSPDAM